MKKNIYGIFDKKASYYTTHFDAINDDVAKRNLTMAVNDPRPNDLTENSSDFEVYKLGTFDDANGIIESEVKFMANLKEFKKQL